MSFKKRLSSGVFVVLGDLSAPEGHDTFQLEDFARNITGRVGPVVLPDTVCGSNGSCRIGESQAGFAVSLSVFCLTHRESLLDPLKSPAVVVGMPEMLMGNSSKGSAQETERVRATGETVTAQTQVGMG